MYLRRFLSPLLADANLQQALHANARRRKQAWQRAMADLPLPWEEARRLLATRREAALDAWHQTLETFLHHLQQRGVHVHHCRDAQEARQVILDLAAQYRVRLIVKSKSMLTEEIGLNPVLQARGIRVVETDLGEFIVQLRGEAPAHIITPAVHLRRQDVGRTFQERLGVPYTEDVAEMTRTARRVLRDLFLQADMGISGVNFGIAETGTLVVVTNEGNGRMVTTLPRVHVAVMGMERLLPRMADLAWALRLLPRAATGQRLTVYVSLLHGPRRPQDPDGPLHRHLVLVDAGRQALAQTVQRDILRCIRCGACLNACPVFAHIGGHGYRDPEGRHTPYTGPMGIVLSPSLFGPTFAGLSYLCTLCGACAEVCPVEIPLPELILNVRRGRAGGRALPYVPAWMRGGLRAFGLLARHPGLFRAAAWGLQRSLPWLAEALPFSLLKGARIRRRIGLPPAGEAGEAPAPAPPAAARSPARPGEPEDLVTRFVQKAQAVDVEVHRVPDVAALIRRLLEWLHEEGRPPIWPWNPEHLPPGLYHALQQAGFSFDPSPQAQVGLTAAAAVAETGSLLLSAGPGRPLAASLLPPVHVALVNVRHIFPDLEQALAAVDPQQGPAAVLVTGPSRTADIEMTLTLGVHGPERVVVFLYNGDAKDA